LLLRALRMREAKPPQSMLWRCFGLNGEKMLSTPADAEISLNHCLKGNKFGKGRAFSYLCAILRRNIHFIIL
ncbi:MAG: hypothetical protein K2L92_01630, partial [Muribaculaceae bacterium]|nr:hypothetical protein [Muribaculaceae bacterium]